MICKKTVVVVGAGASKDLGFPLGPELQASVSKVLTDKTSSFRRYFEGAVQTLFKDERERFRSAMALCERLGGPMRTAASIDNFLDQHKHDLDFVRVAKMAIANEIALAEKGCKIRGGRPGLEVVESAQDYFMLPLLNILVRGHQKGNLEGSLDNLTFVIFNYDRSVERYISKWLEMRFGFDGKRLVKPKNFIHVYGSLGDYFNPNVNNTFEYSGQFAFQNPHFELPEYADRIKVFTEQEDSKVARDIDAAVEEAETILFLGFGFEEQNMRFFKNQNRAKSVFATLMGVEEANADHIKRMLRFKFNVAQDIGSVNGTSKRLFDCYYHPLTSAVGSLPN